MRRQSASILAPSWPEVLQMYKISLWAPFHELDGYFFLPLEKCLFKLFAHFLKISKLFLEKFQVHGKLEWKVQGVSTSCPHTCRASPIISLPCPSGIFLIINEPTLMYLRPKSIVDFKIHSWCYTVYGFCQMYNGMYPSFWYHTEYFHCPKIFWSPPIHNSLPP